MVCVQPEGEVPMSTLGIFILIGAVIALIVVLPLISAHYVTKFKREMKCFLVYDQDLFRNLQLEFSKANIPGSLMTWSPSQEGFDQPGSAHRSPKEIWIPLRCHSAAMEIIESRYDYHTTEFAVVVDGLKKSLK